MDEKLLNRYLEYANSEEALAVLFVKKHLAQAEGHWVDIADCRRYEMSSDRLHFRFVVGGLYKRRMQPHYPSKSAYTSDGSFRERDYDLMTRAIAWEAAHTDIEQQKSKNIAATEFKITGVSYDKNRSAKSYFRDDAPSEIRALAENPYDRTNPLWDIAMQYVNKPEFVYEIRHIYVMKDGA